ncbi:hypothetical protein SAMN02927895_02143 [Belnapia rosea]|nr:hypothetical protein SAMN02927895_02143 [Belnapia rosea]
MPTPTIYGLPHHTHFWLEYPKVWEESNRLVTLDEDIAEHEERAWSELERGI